MKVAVLVFPGSNCDHDVYHVLKHVVGAAPRFVWHQEVSLDGFDAIILPGGFSYGDYLRSGAVAAHAPVMRAVRERAAAGVPVLGICNGFQILCEAGLLPGALQRNRGLRFLSQSVALRVENCATPFTRLYAAGERIELPIAHFDGCYFAPPETLERLEGEGRVVFRYLDNPNGSARDIAGLADATGRIVGLMPHPERASEAILGCDDGRRMFAALAPALAVAAGG